MSGASLEERLGRLTRVRQIQSSPTPSAPARGGQASNAVGNDALADLMRRVERLRASASARFIATTDEVVAGRLGGEVVDDGLLRVERRYPLWHRQGAVALARLAGTDRDEHGCLHWPQRIFPAALRFVDTETTGLAGGTGTLAFLVGIGRLDGPAFAVTQWLMTRFAAEGELLARVANALPTGATLVSYNGKSFDLPLLATRFRLSERRAGVADAPHIDLLHALRRRHGRQLPDCRLATAEAKLLRFVRRDDLAGAEAPRAWHRLLRGDASGMDGVLRHNRDDIVSMAALLPLLAGAAAVPCHV